MRRTQILAVLITVLLLSSSWALGQTARYSILDYGAIADGKTNNAGAINRAIAAASRAGGGTVVVPPGEFVSGPINILSNVTLYLEPGSMIRGSTRIEDYRVPEAAKEESWSGNPNYAALITATNAKNIAIAGRGIIDGSGMAFMNTDRVLDLAYAVGDAGNWIPRLTRQGEDFLSTKNRRWGQSLCPQAEARWNDSNRQM